MTFPEMKRLNVISEFETRVDQTLNNEFHPYRTYDHGGIGTAIEVTENLNSKEIHYITEHLNKRRSYNCIFIKFSDLDKLIRGSKNTSVYKTMKNLIAKCSEKTPAQDTLFFIVIRARY